MTASRFLITGCARSGTAYVAALLSDIGVACGHEEVFSPDNLERGDELTWPDDRVGESSWLAAPFVPNLPAEVAVFHQVREPVAFVRSKLRTRFFETPSWYRSFAERIVPASTRGGSVERALRYWIEWNRLVEQGLEKRGGTRHFHRLEDVDVELVTQITAAVGIEIETARVEAALAALPTNWNSRGERKDDSGFGWDDLPAGPLRDAAFELASHYGYGEPGEDGTLAIR